MDFNRNMETMTIRTTLRFKPKPNFSIQSKRKSSLPNASRFSGVKPSAAIWNTGMNKANPKPSNNPTSKLDPIRIIILYPKYS